MQRHTRGFFLGGIIVMVLSLGSFFFATQVGANDPVDDVPTATATAEPTATATEDPDGIVRAYDVAPEMTIDPAQSYEAVIHLDSGDVRIELFADQAPTYVNNFVFLAERQFYDGLTFHRMLPGFVAQSGDPLGSGFGGPGYVLDEETNALTFERGVLSMAKSPAGVNGSQFFVTLGATPHLNGDFTVFGKVVEGIELLDALTPRDPDDTPDFEGDTIVSIEIIEGGA